MFISGTMSAEVNKGTLLSEVRVATVRKCKSNGLMSVGGGRGVSLVKVCVWCKKVYVLD